MSLIQIGAGSEGYYAQYSAEGGERPGEWMGEGAKKLNLSGEVKTEQLQNILRGFHPDGIRPLVKLSAVRKDRSHIPAWDFCLSPPKDVSLLAGLYDDFKPVVDRCQNEAVVATVEYFEKNAAFTRRGSGGKHLEACGLIIARFDHHTSRNNDPQEHSHLVIANAGSHRDGFGTIVSKYFYDQQTQIQEVYLAALATALCRDMGVKLESTGSKPFEIGDAFNVVGISAELRKLNSSRRAEILSERARRGVTSAYGNDMIARSTRAAKTHLPIETLRPYWRQVTESNGIDLGRMRTAVLQGIAYEQAQSIAPATKLSTNEAGAQSKIQKPELGKEATREDPSSRIPDARNEVAAQERPVTETKDRQERNSSPKAASQALVNDGANSVVAPEITNHTRLSRNEQGSQEPSEDTYEQPAGTQNETGNRFEHSKFESANSDRMEKDAEEQSQKQHSEKSGPQPTGETAEGVDPKTADSILESLARAAGAAGVPDPIIERLLDRALEEFDHKNRKLKGETEAERRQKAEQALPQVLSMAEKLAENKFHLVHRDNIRRGLNGKLTTRDADVTLVKVLNDTGGVACVEAKSGVDSALFVEALADQYAKNWCRPKIFTTSAAAASQLQTVTGREVSTVAQLVYHLKPTRWQEAAHHFKQIARATVKLSTVKQWHFTATSVVIVTEAQSLRTVELEKILAEAKKVEAKVVLVGLSDQLIRREPHNVFEEVGKRVGKHVLEAPPVQTEQWAKDALQQVARGDIRGALSQYAVAQRLHIAKDQRSATIELADYWKKLPKEDRKGKTLVVTSSERDAHALNKILRHHQRRGQFPRVMHQKIDSAWVKRGDRIMFRSGSKPHNIRAGDFGTVERIGLNGMRVRLDRTRWALLARPSVKVKVPKYLYKNITLGYAIAASDAQGVHPERTLVLPKAGGDDVRGLLIQLSAAKRDTRIFTSVRSVGEDIAGINNALPKELQARTQSSYLHAPSATDTEAPEEEVNRKRKVQEDHNPGHGVTL